MQYMVQLEDDAHRVSLENRTCSCRKWEIKGIPCEHAYGVLIDKGLEVEDYVLPWYRTYTWRNTYAEGIVPVRGSKFWPSVPGPRIHRPPSPPTPGRKKHMTNKQRRIRGVNESPTKKVSKLLKRVMHCKICGAANHNSRYHTSKRKRSKRKRTQGEQEQGEQGEQGEASQGQPSQGEGEASASSQVF